MKEQAFDIKNICTCNRLFNEKTLHPLVSVIKLTRCSSEHQIHLDSYSVLLTKCHKDDLTYGHQHYDFSDGTLLFRAPQKTIDFDLCSSGTMLVFHPDLIKCTYLGQIIKQYSFFRYKRNESLHLSCNEKRIAKRILDDIAGELKWGVDIYLYYNIGLTNGNNPTSEQISAINKYLEFLTPAFIMKNLTISVYTGDEEETIKFDGDGEKDESGNPVHEPTSFELLDGEDWNNSNKDIYTTFIGGIEGYYSPYANENEINKYVSKLNSGSITKS